MKRIVMAFSRNNPPTRGHELVFKKVHDLARELSATPIVCMSPSYGNEKNPIPHDEKLELCELMMPQYAYMFYDDPRVTNLFDMLRLLSDPEVELHVVCGEDRAQEYSGKIGKYNGELFSYKSFVVHSAGSREGPGVAGISGTKMRQLARDGNLAEFAAGCPTTSKPEHIMAAYGKVNNPQKSLKEFLEEAVKLSGKKTQVKFDPELSEYQKKDNSEK